MKYTINNPKLVKDSHNPEEENFTGVVKDEDGDIIYYLNGKWHREDGPAALYATGYMKYYMNDKLHRVDGPAAIYADGSVGYYENNLCHREDGPARIYKDGSIQYYLNGKELDISTDEKLKYYLMLRMFE